MKNRRTLGQSLQKNRLSEAAIAFVNGPASQPLETHGDSPQPCRAETVTATATDLTTDSPSPGSVSMTFRLPAELSSRLLRVSLDRKLKREKPFTQQDIIAQALALWLKNQDNPI
jgi:hypothetical protein